MTSNPLTAERARELAGTQLRITVAPILGVPLFAPEDSDGYSDEAPMPSDHELAGRALAWLRQPREEGRPLLTFSMEEDGSSHVHWFVPGVGTENERFSHDDVTALLRLVLLVDIREKQVDNQLP